jgi:hypothetical protein
VKRKAMQLSPVGRSRMPFVSRWMIVDTCLTWFEPLYVYLALSLPILFAPDPEPDLFVFLLHGCREIPVTLLAIQLP